MKTSRHHRVASRPRPAPALHRPATPKALWPLDPRISYLNHGSFGSCPVSVLEFQQALSRRLECQPIDFFVRDLETELDGARHALARFVGAHPDDLVGVPNATTGVNAVLRSLPFTRRDELLVTDHEYNACRNALDFVAQRSGARVVVARVPFPLKHEDDILEAVLRQVGSRTRLALLDHISSQTGMIFPLRRLVRELQKGGVETLVDGAHAPGMIPLHLANLGATYYTGNCHKWLCAPKGAGFLWVRRDRQRLIRPAVISHGANSPRRDRSRYLIEFGWTGTQDPSAFLSVPESIRQVGRMLPGGWPEVMDRNRRLALAAREALCRALHVEPPCPDSMIGALASFPLPDAREQQPPRSPLYLDPLQDRLLAEARIEVPIIPWPGPPKRLLRVSAQLYNSLPEYEQLGKVLARLLTGHR